MERGERWWEGDSSFGGSMIGSSSRSCMSPAEIFVMKPDDAVKTTCVFSVRACVRVCMRVCVRVRVSVCVVVVHVDRI